MEHKHESDGNGGMKARAQLAGWIPNLALLAVASLPANTSIHARWANAAGAPEAVDLGAVKPAEPHTVEWRGQPVWTLRRTPEMPQGPVSAEPLLRNPGSSVSGQQPAYDLAGRVYRGSRAPSNHVIPPQRYLSATAILVGDA